MTGLNGLFVFHAFVNFCSKVGVIVLNIRNCVFLSADVTSVKRWYSYVVKQTYNIWNAIEWKMKD